MKVNMKIGKPEIPPLAYFIIAQSTDENYRAAFASAGNQSTSLNVNRNGVLVSIASLHSELKQGVSIS